MELLQDWNRPQFTQPGGKPMLFYVVFGDFGELPSLDSSKYRSAGVPSGFNLTRSDMERHPDDLTQFQQGYLWDRLREENAELAASVGRCRHGLILNGEIEDCPNLNYLRDAVGLLTFLLDNGGVAIYDPFMFQWWEPARWRARIFDPAGPVPRHHVVVLTSLEPEAELTWFHTRGMRKFGRPELSIHDVSPKLHDAVVDLFERFIELQAFGGLISEGQAIRMRTLPAGMVCRHQGSLDDPDFNNLHVEITSPRDRPWPAAN
jgi:hypothetical protein